MNKSDSERIAGYLKNKGYKSVSKKEEADFIVINMCSVRQSAVDRVYGKLNDFSKIRDKNPKVKIALAGCVLKSDFKKIKDKFDLFLNNADYLKIPPLSENKNKALIPISYGCNNFCSYCVVPYARGPLICRNHKEILKEAEKSIKKGFKEIWLLGQNVNDYQSPINKKINFPKLLKMVNDLPGNFLVYFLSSNPKDFSDKLIDVMAKSQKIAKYLNLPVQSGNNKVLRKMNRAYTVLQYKNLVKKIRKKIPDINLSTDIIVGFPGETKKQFQNTVKLIKEIGFNIAFVAKYSPRPGTAASKMDDNVPLQEKKRRWQILNRIINEKQKW